jgi:uncharacterized membrane protein
MKVKSFLAQVDNERVVAAIRAAESRSAGEIRVHVSNKTVDDAQKAAAAQFEALKMTATKERNGVLIYIAPRSQKFAIIGDQGIHERCGPQFWTDVAGAMAEDFRGARFTDGIVKGVTRAGDRLAEHFPRAAGQADVNELSDEVSED